ncbi:MAG: hypothetical protein ABWY65_08105 [Thermoleophilaceae bacterium]
MPELQHGQRGGGFPLGRRSPRSIESKADTGWLERRTVDATGDRAWFWTRQAETALDMNALNQSVEGRDN